MHKFRILTPSCVGAGVGMLFPERFSSGFRLTNQMVGTNTKAGYPLQNEGGPRGLWPLVSHGDPCCCDKKFGFPTKKKHKSMPAIKF